MQTLAISLLQQGGVLSLIDCTLIEEPDASDEEGESTAAGAAVFSTWPDAQAALTASFRPLSAPRG